MATYIILGIVLLLFALAVTKIIKDRKRGVCSGCGGGCAKCSCSSDCSGHSNPAK